VADAVLAEQILQRCLVEDRVARLDDEQRLLVRPDGFHQVGLGSAHRGLHHVVHLGAPTPEVVVDVNDLAGPRAGLLDQLAHHRHRAPRRRDQEIGVVMVVTIDHVDDDEGRSAHDALHEDGRQRGG
jgi:hypothetical protein